LTIFKNKENIYNHNDSIKYKQLNKEHSKITNLSKNSSKLKEEEKEKEPYIINTN